MKNNCNLQSRTKLLEKVFPIMSTFLRNKTISRTTPLRKEKPFPQFNFASHKCPGIRLSFEYTTTLLSGEGGEGRTGTATMFRKNAVQVYDFLNSFVQDCRSRIGRGEGGDDQLKNNFQHRKWLKPQRRDKKKWFPNQILTLVVSVQGEEFFQKAFLHRGHQQSQ